MAYHPATASWPSTNLPQLVPPTPPDFYICHPFYGNQLAPELCIRAARRLPQGSIPMNYGYPPSHLRPGRYNLPTEIKQEARYGNCFIAVDQAFTTSTFTSASTSGNPPGLIVTPDLFRAAASWLISQCVVSVSYGGYATVSLQSIIDWVANDSTTSQQLQDWAVPLNAIFYTVTITGSVRALPGEYDPEMAEPIADGVRRKGNVARATMIMNYKGMLRRSVDSAFTWWETFRRRGQPQQNQRPQQQHVMTTTSPLPMVYSCDVNLGAPSAADCIQLASSGLGAPSDTVTIGPDSGTKFLSRNTCNVWITAEKATVLTWAQVRAGLSVLVDNCVLHPSTGVKGGRAYTPLFTSVVSGRKKGRRGSASSGDDALPPGVNLTLFDQDFEAAKDPGRELESCTWLQAVGNGRVDGCPSGT
ncbi:hypothetical protein MMC14_007888 [Varicellaria rhodocarpa]|nr:hypothetical protein [Varicellaria rhodocarpa]